MEELNSSGAISVSLAGPLKDSATVALPTFLGGCIGGPVGAVVGNDNFEWPLFLHMCVDSSSLIEGAMAGTGILGISKALGYGNYKPLMTVLMEEFSEQERNNLYDRLWARLQSFVTSPVNQSMVYSALTALTKTVKENPEVMENIKNEIKATLSKKYMTVS